MASAVVSLAGWPALVLTAGRGTRLGPLSDVRAKAALPVAGSTIVERILRGLHAAGIRHAVLNLHHLPATITRVVGDGSGLGLSVRYSWEQPLQGSGGGPKRALPLLDADRFLIVNGDTLTSVGLAALASRHLDGGALVTLAVTAGDTARYGGVEVDDGGRVRGFVPAGRAGTGERGALRHFVGVQAVEAAAFDGAPEDGPSESVGWLYPRLIAARADAVQAFETAAEFLDVGTPRDYLDTVRQVAAREGRPLDVGDGCVIDPSARLAGSVLWDRIRVGAGAELEDCIVADDVVVPSGLRCCREMLIARGGDLERRPFP